MPIKVPSQDMFAQFSCNLEFLILLKLKGSIFKISFEDTSISDEMKISLRLITNESIKHENIY